MTQDSLEYMIDIFLHGILLGGQAEQRSKAPALENL
jgi:hypothetical protein